MHKRVKTVVDLIEAIPVRTQRRFNVETTSCGRCIDVEKTFCGRKQKLTACSILSQQAHTDLLVNDKMKMICFEFF